MHLATIADARKHYCYRCYRAVLQNDPSISLTPQNEGEIEGFLGFLKNWWERIKAHDGQRFIEEKIVAVSSNTFAWVVPSTGMVP
jgi:hypothetical protein